eukprot:Colp12_sorted_trinity150504_noHs@4929
MTVAMLLPAFFLCTVFLFLNIIVFCTMTGGAADITDRKSTGYFEPAKDTAAGGTNDVTGTSAVVSGSNIVYTFTRKLDTGDAADKVIKAGATNIIVALGADFTPNYHGPSNRETGSVTFF